MNNLLEFLQDIYEQGWELWSENGKLSYNAPKNKSTDSILAILKQHKTEILSLLPAYENQQAKNSINETDRSKLVVVPLTEAQKQLWFLDLLEGNSKQAYIDYSYFQLEGAFNIDAMERAIQNIVQRHEALRTRICPEGNFQEILPKVEFKIPFIDFSNSLNGEYESQISQWLEQKIQEPFNLNQAPLFQVYILKLEEKLHQLIIKIHHIISDGFSTGIMLQEISTLYEAYCQGNIAQLEQPMQFREYIESQNKKSRTEKMIGHESYWLEKFSSSIPILDLPTDRPRPPIMSYRGDKQTLSLDAKLCAQIKRVSKQFRCTLFMTLLAAYKILLYKLTADEDIVVGIPTAGRNLEESRNLVGYCTHLLPIRSSLFSNDDSKPLTFADFLIKMRGILLDDYEHQDYPFSQLLNKLNASDIKRDSSRPLLISVVFNLNPSQTIKLLGLECKLISIPKNFVAYDLNLDITETENELLLNLYYNTDLFDGTTIKRWLAHFQNLLSGIVENPHLYVSELPLLSEAERHQLLVEWNDTLTEYPTDKCIHHLFEEQVEKTPNAIAVAFKAEKLTYQQLNERANQLARHLQTLGVKTEVLVGICVEPSIEMVVGLLAILKAGGAYVPLDPNYPQERLQFIFTDAQVSVLLTQTRLVEALPDHDAQVVYLDKDWSQIAQSSSENPDCGVTSENLGYVIYTSGSTGKPKGVQGLHQGVVNRLHWMWETYPFKEDETCSQKTSLSFVDSVWEIFGGLLKGIRTLIIPHEVVKDPYVLIQTLSLNRVSRIVLVPSLLSAILDTGIDLKQELPYLKYWVSSGEILEANLFQRFYQAFPDSLLINLYGSSEVSADATYCETNHSFVSYSLDNLSRLQTLVDYFPEESHTTSQKPEEEVLVEIWKDVLCLETVGVQDNFFDLGGNEDLVAEMIRHTHHILDVLLPANILQTASNIQSLACILKNYETEPGKAATIARLLKQIQMGSLPEIQTELSKCSQ